MKTPDQPYEDGRNRGDGQERALYPQQQHPQQQYGQQDYGPPQQYPPQPAYDYPPQQDFGLPRQDSDPLPEPPRDGAAGRRRGVLIAAAVAVVVVVAAAVGLSAWQPWSGTADGAAQADRSAATVERPGAGAGSASVTGAGEQTDPESVDAVYAAIRRQADAAPMRLRSVGETRPGAVGGAFGIQQGWVGADGTQLITMNAGYGRSSVLYEDGELYINIHELSPRFAERAAQLGGSPVREDTWYRMPVEGMGGVSTILSMSATDPQAATQVVEGSVRSARDMGEDAVDGVPVRKYRVVYDMQKRMENVFDFYGGAVGDDVLDSARALLSDPQFAAILEDQSEATLWVDDQGRIRRQVSGDGSGLEFYGFGEEAQMPEFDRAAVPDFPI